MADQSLDQRCRMLAIAVDEQHGAAARMIEAGEQRRLLAEIARQRNHLHVKRRRRQFAGNGKRAVTTAVIDVDDFTGQRACHGEALRHLDEPRVHTCERCRLVIKRHHDGKSSRGGVRRLAVARQRRYFCFARAGHQLAPAPAYSGFLAISPRRTLSCLCTAKQGSDQPDFGDETAKRYSAALSLAVSTCAAIRSMRRVESRMMSVSRSNSLIFCAQFSANRG